ncbi:MAG TPA: hypothetical protein VFL57_02370 [Bryobacteraceae bacterium]|nr:hypothetical protein [Bryobacteraceae bacterium]
MALTLNCVGDFRNPWKTATEESRHITNWTWSPGTDSWQAVYATNVIVTGSLSQFLGLIEKQKAGNIQRINLLSHGTRGLIAFTGSISAEDGSVSLNSKNGLDLRIADTEPISKGGGKFEESLGAIARRLRNRFAKNAEIVFYLCNSGSDWELLQEVANAFQVVAKGFQKKIWFCPEWPKVPGPPKIDRSFTSLDKCATKKKGIGHLNPDISRQPKAAKE